MKITKQRLKEIIREELTSLNESDELKWDGPPFGPYDLDAENRAGGKPDEYSEEDIVGVTEPRHEGGTPEEKFINKLAFVASSKGAKSGADAAQLFGLSGDKEVEAYLDDLLKKGVVCCPGPSRLRRLPCWPPRRRARIIKIILDTSATHPVY